MTFFFLHGEYAVNRYQSEGVKALKENGDFIISNVEFDASTTMENFIRQLLNECSGSLENIMISADDYHFLNDSTHVQPVNEADRMREIAMIASIISENRFDKLYPKCQGAMNTNDSIAGLAMGFYDAHKHVKDWETHSESIGLNDWEECILHYIDAAILKM